MSLGSHLRAMRQRRGVSVDEVSRLTRVVPRYLEALEADDLSGLPAPVFVRGFIRAYCQALGESPDTALALYHQQAGLPPPSVSVGPAVAAALPGREPRRRSTVLVSFVLLVVLGVALFGVTLALQSGREPGGSRLGQAPEPPGATAPEPSAAPAAGAAEAPAAVASAPGSASGGVAAAASTSMRSAEPRPSPPTVGPAAPTAAARVGEPPAAPADLAAALGPVVAPFRLIARAAEATWIRVRTEDGRLFEETIPAGQSREWVSDGPFTVTLGNAGGVSLELNGQPLPPLGARGAVVSRIVLPPPRP